MSERAEILMRFATPLAERLGRNVGELLDNGLQAQDFPLQSACHVLWEDGSEAKFAYAFAVRLVESKRIGIFTEHCGYFDISGLGVEAVRETSSDGQDFEVIDRLSELISGQRIQSADVVGSSLVVQLDDNRLFVELKTGSIGDVSVGR